MRLANIRKCYQKKELFSRLKIVTFVMNKSSRKKITALILSRIFVNLFILHFF